MADSILAILSLLDIGPFSASSFVERLILLVKFLLSSLIKMFEYLSVKEQKNSECLEIKESIVFFLNIVKKIPILFLNTSI